MKRAPIRSALFLFFFYILVALECVFLLPLIFLPRRAFMYLVVGTFLNSVYFLERDILGLNYEIRGAEHLPKDGAYIVAAKHQSAYETMKLHFLFKDPAIILKKELFSVPLWGRYLKKSDVIAIDRSTPDAAIESIQSGARRMQAQGRPIIIFPQGTRVNVDHSAKEKPYKVGVARVQEATNLPIIPLAMNAGCYWPRHGWLKSSGTVVFKFLPPVAPGMERSALVKKLEHDIETESNALAAEARTRSTQKKSRRGRMIFFVSLWLLVGAFLAYSWYWHKIADAIKTEYPIALRDMTGSDIEFQAPNVSGYPFKIRLDIAEETLENTQGSVTLHNIRAEGWPLPYLPIAVQAGPISVQEASWAHPLILDSFSGEFTLRDPVLSIQDGTLTQGAFKAVLNGDADISQEPIPLLDLDLTIENHQDFLQILSINEIIEPRMALFLGAGLAALADQDGIIHVPVMQKGQTLYAGPLPIMSLPIARVIAPSRTEVIAPAQTDAPLLEENEAEVIAPGVTETPAPLTSEGGFPEMPDPQAPSP